jgi:DNA-binding transcriptional regulator YdaS (Cro superfamily)
MHPLKAWLKDNSETARALATRMKRQGCKTISASYLSQIITGYRRPGPDIALAIVNATRGGVSLEELYLAAPVPQSAA